MGLVDYTHPEKIPAQHIPLDRRDARLYWRLDELPPTHPFYSPRWAMFRYLDWLEGGSAWLQASAIDADLQALTATQQTADELRPVVGSDDPAFDEALAQSLLLLGWRPLVAEVSLVDQDS